MHTASESTARKLKWLPREQWQRPYAEQQSNPDLSGRSPFTGMFSGERPALRLMFTAGLVRRDYADKMAALWSLQLRYHHLTLLTTSPVTQTITGMMLCVVLTVHL